MMQPDNRKNGVGAKKGWVTRRRTMANRRAALDRLIEVSDSISSELVVGERSEVPGKYAIGALTLINWRDRVCSALRILEAQPMKRGRGGTNDAR
jgi:hypothetical protein